jgi:hypothetical protein
MGNGLLDRDAGDENINLLLSSEYVCLTVYLQ